MPINNNSPSIRVNSKLDLETPSWGPALCAHWYCRIEETKHGRSPFESASWKWNSQLIAFPSNTRPTIPIRTSHPSILHSTANVHPNDRNNPLLDLWLVKTNESPIHCGPVSTSSSNHLLPAHTHSNFLYSQIIQLVYIKSAFFFPLGFCSAISASLGYFL